MPALWLDPLFLELGAAVTASACASLIRVGGRPSWARDIRLYGHSWGGLSAIRLSQKIKGDNWNFKEDTVDVLATIDPIRIARCAPDWCGGVFDNVVTFWNRYQSKTARGETIIPVPFRPLRPHGEDVPSLSQDGGNNQVDLNPTGIVTTTVLGNPQHINHINIVRHVAADVLHLLQH